MLYCSQEKETGVLLFSGSEKEKCSLLFLRKENMNTPVIKEGNWCSTVSGEGNWCSTVSGEGIWCSTVLGRRAMGLYLLVLSV